MSFKAFCNYCSCEECITGISDYGGLKHAKTDNDDWICNVCYHYDLCTADGPNRNISGPCEDLGCEHRPKLTSDWENGKTKVSAMGNP